MNNKISKRLLTRAAVIALTITSVGTATGVAQAAPTKGVNTPMPISSEIVTKDCPTKNPDCGNLPTPAMKSGIRW